GGGIEAGILGGAGTVDGAAELDAARRGGGGGVWAAGRPGPLRSEGIGAGAAFASAVGRAGGAVSALTGPWLVP
ncbi:MAG: hypothetical protein OXR73_04815, partial [Myxococcales bacterium]|nr:hypothetical protein [Myxococcales bacterium]